MPLRLPRRSRERQSRERLSRACFVEPLEKRQFLTAVVNGLFQGTNTGFDGDRMFEYMQQDGSSVRISVFGNVTAEFIGGRTPDASFNVIIRDLVPAGNTTDDGVDLFSIYVVDADINSAIAIAVVPAPTAPVRPMMPFDGSAGSLSIFDAQNGDIEQVDLGPGGVYIGARTHDFTDQDLNDRPITTPPDGRRRFGFRPSSAGELFSGLECAPGVSLGKFLLGGTITGLVDIPGNVRLFYAGSILTGDAQGLTADSTSSIRNNFFVGGDIEHLVCGQSMGTAATLEQDEIEDIVYKSGFDLQVNGRIGWVRTLDSFLGAAVVRNHESVQGLGIAQEELEFSGDTIPAMNDDTYFDPFFRGDQASLGGKSRNAAYNNDTFNTAQHLGTLFSQDLNSREAIQVRGFTDTIHGDEIDFYAVSLMAGQTAQVQLLDSFSAIGVVDPDGRLIASDYANGVDRLVRGNKPFRFTADRPGAYRIVIANRGDINFNGVTDPGEDIASVSPDFYELRITRVADIAMGGLIADVHIATFDAGSDGITVERGDIGAVRAGTLGTGTIFSFSNPWLVEDGNMRSVEALSMGILRSTPTLTFVGLGPDFLVPGGSIGLLRTTGLDAGNSIMFINDDLRVNATVDLINDDLSRIPRSLAVGADIQLVESASNMQATLLANRSIGVIRAAQVSGILGSSPGVWAVNVDGIGDDGRIDLVDVQNNLGELGPGGPAIATGPGGNLRYMRVGGTVFRDRFFGGGGGQTTNFQPGETVRLTDDNGTAVTMNAVPRTRFNDPITGIPQPGFNNPGSLSVLTYPVRDKAGSAIVRVTVNPGAGDLGRGFDAVSGARGRGGSVEFGEIVVISPGTDLVFDPFTRQFTSEATTNPPNNAEGQIASVSLGGASPIDVFSIEVRSAVGGEFTGATSIGNGTPGEIVNVRAAHIGAISANTVGLAKSSTGAAVNGVNILSNAYPFNQQRNLVAAANASGPGHIGSVRARAGLGNIFAAGTIGTVTANADGRNVAGVFEGINGPILAVHDGGTITADTGNIISVSIGEGITGSGTGNVAFAGLFADGQIDRVRNTGAGSDIHGDIVSRGLTPPVQTRVVNGVTQTTPDFFIGDIILNNGAIIDADIMTVTTFEDSRELDDELVIPQRANVVSAPVFQIRSIQIGGLGGIIGSNIAVDDMGPITIRSGFGVITTLINSLGDSVIDGIDTDGYGIRSSVISGGAVVNRLIARDGGKRLDTRIYTGSVRNSERLSFDPHSGNFLDETNDLHRYLGTTRGSPRRIGLSDSGVIEDTSVSVSRDLGVLQAHRIIGRDVFTTDGFGRPRRMSFGELAYPMRLSIGNSVGTMRVTDIVDGLSLITGGLDNFTATGDVMNTAVSVTGRIGTLGAGAFRGTTSLEARGPEGAIGTITTKRSLYASIATTVDIGMIKVGTDLGSPSVGTSRNLGMLIVDGSILTGANVRVARTLGTLGVGRDVKAGATIRADEITNQTIKGQVLGDIIIT